MTELSERQESPRRVLRGNDSVRARHYVSSDDRRAIRQVAGSGAAALLLSLLLIGGASARADAFGQDEGSGHPKYKFTTILDSQQDGLDPTRCAAINNVGTVAVTVRDAVSGLTKIITKRDANEAPVVVADTRSVTDFPTLCDNGFSSLPSDPSINDNGEVAFQGNPRRVSLAARLDCATAEQRARRQGVFLGQGGPLTTIAHTINQPGGDFIAEFLVADQSVSNSGHVAFVPELDGTFQQGLYVGSRNGTFDQRFLVDQPAPGGFNFNNISSRVSMNNLLQIAFRSGLNDSDTSGIFLSSPGGQVRTIVDNSGGLSADDPSLNNSGLVAFTGDRFDDNFNQIFSINTSRGAGVTTVAESRPGGYSFFREPSLNDLDQVAFTAELQPDPNIFTTLQGVFTGPNPIADKVLQAGDRYKGVLVTSVVSCAEALNNRGEIVMTVHSENPDTFERRTFIVKASPRD
jgi:hypothetical protein